MFLQVSVILFMGGGVPGPGGWSGLRGVPGSRGGLVLGGGAPGPQGWSDPGGCLVPGGGWSGGLGPRGWVPGEPNPQTATAAGGTHPTGMHSCYDLFLQGRGGGIRY